MADYQGYNNMPSNNDISDHTVSRYDYRKVYDSVSGNLNRDTMEKQMQEAVNISDKVRGSY